MRRKKDKSNGITALYERLSRDDDNAGESNSIVHQKQMLEDYAMKHGFTNLVHFTDDGWSGATFDRPSWNRLVEGVKNGEITACICKDMSRIGRDHLQVGFFTDILFREKEVRFIAINNGIDSDRQETSEFAPFLNIMNEWFVRDTSKKIKAVLKSRGSSGNAHTSNIPPYGYLKDPENPDHWIIDELSATFEDVEQLFYRQRYRDFVTRQNERNVKNRHPERNKETGDLLKSKKTCPEETVYQIGTLDNHVPPELLIEIVTEFMEIVNERFGSHVHILNWALHLDESTPHIHERHVFDCENQYGEIAPQQEKALEALGFELPEPEKPVGRKNNRKMTFDSACRVLLFDVAKKHGLQLEEEPEYGGRAYLEKQDYILFKQKEQLAAQEQKLEELTMKIEDVEALVDEVADIAYDKAVEVVADTVKLETHKEDIKLVEQSKAWVLSPERKASKKEVEYAVKRLDGVIARITNAMKYR